MNNQVMLYYGLFALALVLFLIPVSAVQTLSVILLLLCVWFFHRARRAVTDEDGLDSNHYQWLYRSFWVFNLYAVIAFILYIGIFSANADHTIMLDMKQRIMNGEMVPPEEIRSLESLYKQANLSLLMLLNGLIVGPLMLWIGYRLFKGMRFYRKGQKIDNIKSWWT